MFTPFLTTVFLKDVLAGAFIAIYWVLKKIPIKYLAGNKVLVNTVL